MPSSFGIADCCESELVTFTKGEGRDNAQPNVVGSCRCLFQGYVTNSVRFELNAGEDGVFWLGLAVSIRDEGGAVDQRALQ